MRKPSVANIREAVDKSGYVLELRLAPKLERAGFAVFPAKQFKDQDTGKSREIDLYGWRWVDVHTTEVKVGDITVVLADRFDTNLVIECKSTDAPLIFFTRKDPHPSFVHVLFGGFPEMLWQWDQDFGEVIGAPHDMEFGFGDFHSAGYVQYPAYRFAKLITKKQKELAWELDHAGIYPAIDKVCKAASYIHEKAVRDSQYREPEDTGQFHLHLTCPVLVIAGDIYECRVSECGYKLFPRDNIFLDWALDSEKVQGEFRIAVVKERAFARYLSHIDADIRGISRALRTNTERLRVAARIEREKPAEVHKATGAI